MVRAVYEAASAMLTQIISQDVHTHNLANANTVGFKRYLAKAAEGLGPRAEVDATIGDVRVTEAPLDVALRSDGYFVCAGAGGRYCTRNGSFTRNGDGVLVNNSGHAVLGQRGPITVGSGEVRIGDDGSVFAEGRRVDRLLVVTAPPGQRLGDSEMVAAAGTTPVANPAMVSGALENSNVNLARELGAIRNGYRMYEANANIIRTTDRTLGRLIDSTTA